MFWRWLQVWLIAGQIQAAAEPIIIGCPHPWGFLEDKESHNVVQMAVSEINAREA